MLEPLVSKDQIRPIKNADKPSNDNKGKLLPAVEGENRRLSTATSFTPPKTGRNIL